MYQNQNGTGTFWKYQRVAELIKKVDADWAAFLVVLIHYVLDCSSRCMVYIFATAQFSTIQYKSHETRGNVRLKQCPVSVFHLLGIEWVMPRCW